MQNRPDRSLAFLGLCARAGRLICGVPLICDAMRAGRRGKIPLLVVEAADTSPNTHKRITDRCAYYGTEVLRSSADGGELAHAVGHSGVLAAVAVTDRSMADALRAMLVQSG
ncbi:MAG: hypothetical protein IKD37_08510 [Clostridia bacterium]|nr:hypothetical protein [Clostridia bacterium]